MPQSGIGREWRSIHAESKIQGKYTSMQDAIRTRDTALQGSVNPVLARFGESSEAVQYSGRAANGAWKCPFSTRGVAND
jgi:FPC/CPF motif-containing protein YcgG